jgi:3-oxoacyl-[acyl-carrier-protein] synthase-3
VQKKLMLPEVPFEIIGTGYFVPERIVTNEEFEKEYNVPAAWIEQVSGIRERRVARKDQACSDLALPACQAALSDAKISPQDLDLIILTSMGPDYASPPTSCVLQGVLGASKAAAFDLDCACLGFPWALYVAANLTRTGKFNTVLVVSSELGSRCANYNDPNSFILLGDGAGAAVIRKAETNRGILASYFRADGTKCDVASIQAWGSRYSRLPPNEIDEHGFKMNGKQIYRFATRAIPEAIAAVTQLAKISNDDLSLVIAHQANKRILQSAIKKNNIPEGKYFVDIDRFGNTGSATIPLALADARSQGRIKPGDIVALVGFGAGLSWGSVLVQF